LARPGSTTSTTTPLARCSRRFFTRFLTLATSAKRPVICHIRDAHDDAIAILRAGPLPDAGGVLHCFREMSSTRRATSTWALPLVFRRAHLQKVRRPTQSGGLRPNRSHPRRNRFPIPGAHSHRGKRNEPAFVLETLHVLAQVRGISPAQAAEATTANTFRLFNLDLPSPTTRRRGLTPAPDIRYSLTCQRKTLHSLASNFATRRSDLRAKVRA